MFLSYAQNFEDVRLRRCFPEATGTYVDVGASEPSRLSPTYAFYIAGWSGLLIEPLPERVRELRALRERDVIIEAAADEPEHARPATLYRSAGRGGMSTILEQRGQAMQAELETRIVLEVARITLDQACEQAFGPARGYDFLKIDVEGCEERALRGASLQMWRPKVVLTEAEVPGSRNEAVYAHLSSNGFRFTLHDGVNDFYVAEECAEFSSLLAAPLNVHDQFHRVADLGSPFANADHPDASWARSFAQVVVKALASIDDAALLAAYSESFLEGALAAPADAKSATAAIRLLLGRRASTEEASALAQQAPTLRALLALLMQGPEFRERRGRAIASM